MFLHVIFSVNYKKTSDNKNVTANVNENDQVFQGE